jgi:general secretion pathway protein I
MGGIATMALTIIYPTLKPMLEASIRRVTVSVKWNEGSSARDFSVVEYVTNPMQGLPPMGSASSSAGPFDFLKGLTGSGPPTTPGGR